MKKYLLLLGTLGVICAGDVFAAAEADDVRAVSNKLRESGVLNAVASDFTINHSIAVAVVAHAPRSIASALISNPEARATVLEWLAKDAAARAEIVAEGARH